jgi:transcriptional regulator with XRE-family HTH domain
VIRLPGLRYQRDLALLTQEELASKAGIVRPQISRLENGATARPSTIRKLARALGCEPADLILDTNKNVPAGGKSGRDIL